jgi:hypothetical protein
LAGIAAVLTGIGHILRWSLSDVAKMYFEVLSL